MSVFEYKIKENVNYNKIKKLFTVPISQESINTIMEMWSVYKKGYFFNAKCVRLERVEARMDTTYITLSKTDFYSLVISNIIRPQIQGFCEFVDANYGERFYKSCMKELLAYYENVQEYHNIEELICAGELSNALAVSVLVKDRYDNLLLVQRSKNVGIGKNLFSVSATGAVDEADWCTEEPIKECVKRELKEELNLAVEVENIELLYIVAGVEKLQPVAILNVYVDYDLGHGIENARGAVDYDLEVNKIYICKKEELKRIIEEQEFTEAAKFHLLREL